MRWLQRQIGYEANRGSQVLLGLRGGCQCGRGYQGSFPARAEAIVPSEQANPTALF
jgi:hypothetical protein